MQRRSSRTISSMKTQCFITRWNTEKTVENKTRGEVFLTNLREKHCFYCFSDWYFTLMVGQLCFRPFFASLTNLISLQQLLTHQGTGSDCLSYRKCLKLTALFCISSHTKVNFLSFKESLLLNSSYRWLSIFRGQNSEDPREIAFRGWKRNIEYWILNIEFRLVWIFKNSVWIWINVLE